MSGCHTNSKWEQKIPSTEQWKEKGQVQNFGCKSQVQKQNQSESCPRWHRECGGVSCRKRRSGLIFKLNFCRAPCQVCSIPAWITPGFVCLQLHSIKILTVQKESLPSPSLAGEIHFLFTGKVNHFLKVGTFPGDSQK